MHVYSTVVVALFNSNTILLYLCPFEDACPFWEIVKIIKDFSVPKFS